MRGFFGMILGAFLTVAAAFLFDTWATGPATTTGANAGTVTQRPMVNWDVVGANWRIVQQRARAAWSTLSEKISG